MITMFMIQNMQIEDLNVRASLYAIFHKTCQIETNNRSDIRPFCILYPAGHFTPHSRYPAGYLSRYPDIKFSIRLLPDMNSTILPISGIALRPYTWPI